MPKYLISLKEGGFSGAPTIGPNASLAGMLASCQPAISHGARHTGRATCLLACLLAPLFFVDPFTHHARRWQTNTWR